MANPQVENGHFLIANELAEALCRINLSAYEWRVLMYVIRKTYGWKKKFDVISISQIASGTGLQRSHACRAKASLVAKNVLQMDGDRIGPNKDYDTWNVTNSGTVPKSVTNRDSSPKTQKRYQSRHCAFLGDGVTNSGNKALPIQALQKTSKDTITKEREHFSKTTCDGTTTDGPKVAEKKPSRKRKIFKPPTPEEVREYARSIDYWSLSAEQFVDFYSAKGWLIGRNKMKDWKAAVRTWRHKDEKDGKKTGRPKQGEPGWEATEEEADKIFREVGIAS